MEISRRTLLRTAAMGAAGAALNLGVAGRAFAAKELIVGIVYVGARDDFGWNQAHAVAIKSLKEVPGVKVVEEENVPETDAVSKSMESMINLDSAGLILATSFGYYSPFVVDLAKKYPDVEFRHAAPLWNKDKDPKNAGSYFGYLNQGHYVDGVAAGLSTKTNKLGFVAAKPIASVLSNINFVHARRTLGQSERDGASDLHRRLVHARPRSRGCQCAGRRRLRRRDLPCGRTQGRRRDRGEARRDELRP
jgi:simple sugar transport system substrate-binding protein